jgi:hypothetical protein
LSLSGSLRLRDKRVMVERKCGPENNVLGENNQCVLTSDDKSTAAQSATAGGGFARWS